MNEKLENQSSDIPITNKETIGDRIFGFSSMQGYRPSMEDFHQHFLQLDDHPKWKHWKYFAIFDGHSGMSTARNASDYLHIHFLNQFNRLIQLNQQKTTKTTTKKNIQTKQFRRAIKKAFFKLDQNLREINDDHSGSVCIACLINRKKIYLINVGDARAILISNHGQVLTSTHDHKPDDPKEEKRIYECGGHITQKSSKDILRVEHRLAMTRVLGDFSLDKNLVPPIPDILIYPRISSSYVILASDGVWNVMSNQQVAQFVSEKLLTTNQLDQIASQLLDLCLEKNSRDNISVYIVQL